MSQMMGPTIKFLYCYSWGYQKVDIIRFRRKGQSRPNYFCSQVFQQYAGILQQKYPDLSIRGDNFPPGGFRLQAAQILSVIKFLVIMMVLARWALIISTLDSTKLFSALTHLPVWANPPRAGLSGSSTTRSMLAWWLSSSSTVPSSKQSNHLKWLCFSLSCWDSAYQHGGLWDYIEWHAGKSCKASFTTWSPLYSQVWSKIEAGRIPQPGELFQIIENQMNMKVTCD